MLLVTVMTEQPDQFKRSARPDTVQERSRPPTSHVRNLLYDLIVRFRKDANEASDVQTRALFEFAAEVISGLSRALRQHEERVGSEHSSGPS